MTTKRVVADDELGRLANKQWELFRRVKEGTLDSALVLNALQSIIENETDQLDVEKVGWKISSKVHEIIVVEGHDFVTHVKELGFVWDYKNCQENPFILEGDGKCRRKNSRFRLARLTTSGDVPVSVIKTYAELSGYDLATSWELLSFVSQSTAMRVIKEATHIIALGDYGRTKWEDTNRESYAHVMVDDYPKGRTWSFNHYSHENTPRKLDDKRVGTCYYILLRERE